MRMPGQLDSRNRPTDAFVRARRRMIDEQLITRGIGHERVLEAMFRVPRHEFVDIGQSDAAYADRPLPIGHGQTISQPYIVAYMVEALDLPPGARVLEIGTGSGYQAAVLAAAGFNVFTTEIVSALADEAKTRLDRLGFGGVHVQLRDGSLGWPEHAPFDGILASAAPREVPKALFDQVAMHGVLVIPLGGDVQELRRYRKTPAGFRGEKLLSVRFVPMTGDT